MWNRKLKAFTLIEIMVSLVITSVVMLMAAYGFNTVVTLSDTERSSLSVSKASYFLLVDVEKQFMTGKIIETQFNDLTIGEVVFELGPELAFRKQINRIDTLPTFLDNPVYAYAIISRINSATSIQDSLSFSAGEATYALTRQSSLPNYINQRIQHGED